MRVALRYYSDTLTLAQITVPNMNMHEHFWAVSTINTYVIKLKRSDTAEISICHYLDKLLAPHNALSLSINTAQHKPFPFHLFAFWIDAFKSDKMFVSIVADNSWIYVSSSILFGWKCHDICVLKFRKVFHGSCWKSSSLRRYICDGISKTRVIATFWNSLKFVNNTYVEIRWFDRHLCIAWSFDIVPSPSYSVIYDNFIVSST